MTNPIGVYWSVMHRRATDYDFMRSIQPGVVKIMDGGPEDYGWVYQNCPNSLVIARDWAMSEQKEDVVRDAHGTGLRHAQEWSNHANRLGLDKARTFVLGINEPPVWDAGWPEALRVYTIAFLDECKRLGLRAGALQFSVGWPANVAADAPPDWSPYWGVDAAILNGNHALVVHEYWADLGPEENWGWWCGRVLTCPWQVPIIIGETGVDQYVKFGGIDQQNRGWQGVLGMHPTRYAQECHVYASHMNTDPRFMGYNIFTCDFANSEWWSFDVEPAYGDLLALPPLPQNPWFVPSAGQTYTTYLPTVSGE